MQQHLAFIAHKIEREQVFQRTKDGYVNATAMCRAAGKHLPQYLELKTTKEFAAILQEDTGLQWQELIQSNLGSDANERGTWVHPQIAINLAQWLSPRFSVSVSKWVTDWLSGNYANNKSRLPYHLARYIANAPSVPVGHFSILTEMTQLLIAPMERDGYNLPERMLPDISEGKMFCKWLRDKKGIDTDFLPTYLHKFDDGRVVNAKAYPDELLAEFRKHFREEWLPNRAIEYFKGRDSAALEYLPKLLKNSKKAS